MMLNGGSKELLGLRLATDSESRCYQRILGPLAAYPHLHVRFERRGQLRELRVEKALSDVPTFPAEIFVKDEGGRVYLHRAI